MPFSFRHSKWTLAVLTLSAAVLLTGCAEEAADSTAASSASTAPAAASVPPSGATTEQTSELLASLTAEEMEQLISGSTTLAQLEQQRFNLSQTAEAAEAPADSASGEVSASSENPTSASSTASAGTSASSYDTELQALINQLYAVKARAESSLNSTIAAAKSEYHALPENQQTQTKKVAIVMGKTAELKKLESSCDKEVNDIVSQMRALLQENGQSTELADQALASYKAQKSAMYSSLKSQLMG